MGRQLVWARDRVWGQVEDQVRGQIDEEAVELTCELTT